MKSAAYLTCFIVLLASITRAGVIVESDIFWQTRAGLDFLSSGQIIGPDTWSYLPQGKWIPNSWLWNLVLAAFYKLSSEWGHFVYGIFCIGLCLSILVFAARKLQAKWEYISFVLCILIVLSFPVLSIRPHIFGAIASGFLLIFLPAITKSIPTRPIRSAILFFFFNVLAINIHLAWPAALTVFLVSALVYFFKTLAFRKAMFASLTLSISGILGLLINPVGINLLNHAHFTISHSTPVISEWQGVWKTPLYIPGLLLGFFSVFIAKKNTQLLLWAIPASIYAILGTFALRFAPWSFVFAAPVWASYLSSLNVTAWWKKRHRSYLSILVLAFCGTLIPTTVKSLKLHGLPDYYFLLQRLPQNCRLFASAVHSGSVPLFRPDLKIYIDGRNDYWGQSRYKFALETLNNPTAEALNSTNANCFIARSHSNLANFFKQHEKKYTRIHSDQELEAWSTSLQTIFR